jgi:hypothetical protein
MLGEAFTAAGCQVFYSFQDADKEAAYWARQEGAYAVVADDTDFLCYEGVERGWSANMVVAGSGEDIEGFTLKPSKR